MKRHLVMILCLITMAVSVNAQTISGKLVDEQNQPLAYANIVLLSLPDSTFVSGTISDEMGGFRLSKDEKGKLVRISSVGYVTLYKEVLEELGTIRMNPDTKLLGEVVVKANLPIIRAKGDAMVTTVTGTLLEKAGNANDLLDKIPNVSAEGGNVNVFGSGKAEIYINGRKMRNTSELEQLSSDNIKSVEVVHTPGARYDAEVKAVVRIITKKPQGEGFGFNNIISTNYKWDWSFNEQFDFNYRKGGFDLGGTLFGANSVGTQKKTLIQHSYLENHWMQESYSDQKFTTRNMTAMLSANYMLNGNHSFGVRYQFDRTPKSDFGFPMSTEVTKDDAFFETSEMTSMQKRQSTGHELNLYYNGKVKDWTIDFNADGMWGYTYQNDLAEENIRSVEDDEDVTVTSHSRTENSLYAAKLILSHPLAGGQLSFGSEYTYAQRINGYENLEGILNDDDSEITDNGISVFAEYARRFGKVQAQAGVRYEHITSDYYEYGKKVEEQSRKYDNLFPSLALSFPLGKVQMQLAYRASIKRPTYWDLRGNITYANRYTYETGNPLLQPTIIQSLSLNTVYRWMSLSLSYNHYKNDYTSYVRAYSEENPTIGLLTREHLAPYNRLSASLTLSPVIGKWSPRWGVQVQRYDCKVNTPQGVKTFDNPLATLSWRNAVKFTDSFWINADAFYQTKGQADNTKYLEDSWYMNLNLYKSFLNNRMSLQLQVTDLFNTRKSHVLMYSGLRTMELDNEMCRTVSLTFRYKFNPTKSKYKGTGAGQSQKARM
ncbi:MAG: TonB-dependent receptor [Bacteroides sp.]|nr:TonB-dependent receptor [Bacteroides sp.]